MANEASNKRSKRSKKTNTRTRRKDNTVNINTVNKQEPPATLPKLGVNGVERVPSNAPTMAIAPSDYEHIYHEGPNTGATTTVQSPPQQAPAVVAQPSPPVTRPTPPPPPFALPMAQSPPLMAGNVNQRVHSPDLYSPAHGVQQNFDRMPYAVEVQVTPDGYTMLGQAADPNVTRRVALPAYIVRASNQFSRAALARVARYLASRAEGRL